MKRTAIVCGLLLLVAVAHSQDAGQVEAQAAARKAALSLRDAEVKADYPTFVSFMPARLIQSLGGREAAAAGIAKDIRAARDARISLSNYTVGECGKIHKGGSDLYVVIPTTKELKLPMGKAIADEYLLGVSADNGKTWKFAESHHVAVEEKRDALFPTFPKSLTLPIKKSPSYVD